jgi:hypothetical protein
MTCYEDMHMFCHNQKISGLIFRNLKSFQHVSRFMLSTHVESSYVAKFTYSYFSI